MMFYFIIFFNMKQLICRVVGQTEPSFVTTVTDMRKLG